MSALPPDADVTEPSPVEHVFHRVDPDEHYRPLVAAFFESMRELDQANDVLLCARRTLLEAGYRAHPVTDPLGSLTAITNKQLLFSGWFKQNGGPTDTAPHPFSDPFNTLLARDTTAAVFTEWRSMLAGLTPDDCFFRMMFDHEVGRACGFDVAFGDHPGDFIVWGSARDRVDGYGNAVSPPVGCWISMGLKEIL